MKTTRKQQLQIDLQNHFSRFLLELEAMPPAMAKLGTIPGHLAGGQVTGQELVAYALEWIELAIRWCDRVEAGHELEGPTEGVRWGQDEELAAYLYGRFEQTGAKLPLPELEQAHRRLIERLEQGDEELFSTPCTPGGQGLTEVVHSHLLKFYKDELILLRTWKKGLGWI